MESGSDADRQNKKRLIRRRPSSKSYENYMVNRAPVIDKVIQANSYRWLKSGSPSAHETSHLRLLPSRPDRVHEHSLRRTQLSTPRVRARPHITVPLTGIQPRYSGLRVTGHRYLPV